MRAAVHAGNPADHDAVFFTVAGDISKRVGVDRRHAVVIAVQSPGVHVPAVAVTTGRRRNIYIRPCVCDQSAAKRVTHQTSGVNHADFRRGVDNARNATMIDFKSAGRFGD